ncbi:MULTISPECIES: AI-2E family transporter [Turicibacter]|uniref:AI-2E family transporter n=1 Tax=Turicibacter TaxID=191303 RepID=UPI001021E1F6|nr:MULTISPECIES: AI-2E family transporter [Turicibacter]MBP3904136.1 AI-2E family transporter [Turicibacter sp.]MCU7198128.1 AI-2E family transporter [Turicibacter sanguinis]MCU7202454.1 AI-2E family transporter [Turicibacter sanguinis]MCU7211867.1 AI-2E family transporter [Turicibacter sanguinis]MDB8438833.1 AI-2E family transporter [Turicibacter sanguinis]
MFAHLKNNKKLLYSIMAFTVGLALILAFNLIQNLQLIIAAIKEFMAVITPVIIAFAIAYILWKPTVFVEKNLQKMTKKLMKRDLSSGASRGISLLIVVSLVVMLILLLFNTIIPPIITNLKLLVDSIPALHQTFNKYIDDISPYIQSFITEEQINEITRAITNLLSYIATQILQFGTGMITNMTGFIISVLTTIILSIYFLKDKETLTRSVYKAGQTLLTPNGLKRSQQFLKDLDAVFGGFLIAQLIAAILAGIFSSLILIAIGHPFALLVGLVTGVANVIPYVGPILGAVLGGLLGLFSSLKMAILSLVLLTIYQQLDANVIQPKLLSNSVGLNPVWVLIAILIGGHYLGMLGMIVSIPSAALFQIYMTRRYNRLKAANRI